MADLAHPLNQSEAFERTCRHLGIAVSRLDHGAGSCLLQSRKLPLIGNFNLISRGPVVAEESAFVELINQARRSVKGPLVVNAPTNTTRAGGIKIAGGAEMAVMRLLAPDKMRTRLDQKWRNQLKKAEASGIRVSDQPLDAIKHAWFLEAEAKQQKSRGYKSYPAAFLLAFAAVNKGDARLYSATLNGEQIAGMLVLKHGLMATYQAGLTTPLGRQICAHNLLLWRIMCDLERKGFTHLDLGRADLSDGLRRFKRGSGADFETLAGSYLFHHWFLPKRAHARAEPLGSASRA